MTVKSTLSRRLRKNRKNRSRWASHPSRARGLRLENLEPRCMLTSMPGLDGAGTFDDGPEGEGDTRDYMEGELIIRFEADAPQMGRDLVLQTEGASLLYSYYDTDFALIQLAGSDGGVDVGTSDMDSVVDHWESLPYIDYAAPNYIWDIEVSAVPNDPLVPLQWAYNNVGLTGGTIDADIDAFEAWDIFTGTKDVVVAIIDTGMDYRHEDLVDNVWTNPGEIPGDGIDNDGNGYIDDIHGISTTVGPMGTDPIDITGHGTHVSGTVGAKGNNGLGVTGVNWDVQLMAIKILGEPNEIVTEASIAQGIDYATRMREEYGINIVASNNSWGSASPGQPPSLLHYTTIERHINSGIVFVAAAGNDNWNNNDVNAVYPAGYDLDGIISVAATDDFDQLASYSNYGPTTVDLGAPGGFGIDGSIYDIYSTWPPTVPDTAGLLGTRYDSIHGTSMATPHVTGVAALIRGLAPEYTVADTVDLILRSVDPLPVLDGFVRSGGRLNAATCLENIAFSTVSGTVWSDDNGNGQRDSGEAGLAGWTVYVDLNDNGVMDVDDPSAVSGAGGAYEIQVFEAPGSYVVREVVKPNWELTFPSSGRHIITIVDRGDAITGIDFGNHPEPGSVTGFKFHDLDGDGFRDPGEPGRGGVWIYADVNNDGMIGLLEPATVTANDGSYQLHDVPPGEVVIREALPLGWTTTYPALGYHIVDVIPAATVANIDFGNFASYDFGDAPSALGYATLAIDGGPSHGVTPGYQLGLLIDSEDDGLPSSTAAGDDLDNLDDEDGVVISGPFFQGTTTTVQVTVETSGYPRGYLQGFLDMNGNGSFSDPGEQIITNVRLDSGVHNISFDIPSTGVIVGSTFARFRYGLEMDLGPTGPSSAGEVEDYAVLILKDNPVANPDVYDVEQDSINNTLSVLDNDFPSSSGNLSIIDVTQPPNGNVTIAPGSQALIYTPDFGFFGPPTDDFTYTIDDGTGKTDSTTVSVLVRPQLVAPMAVDDNYQVSGGANDLDVLTNDLTGILGTMQLISVSVPGSGTTSIDDNGTADPLDDFIVYTPNGSFDRADQFEYTISNANGLSTATVTVFQDPAPLDDLSIDLSLTFEDSQGTPITEIGVNEQFDVILSIQDIRDGFNPEDMGVFSIFLDMLYDRSLVLPVLDPNNPVGVEIAYSTDYPEVLNDAEGDADTPGLLNEIGAYSSSFIPLQDGVLEVLRVTFTANSAGVATFRSDPFDEPFADTPGGIVGREISFYTAVPDAEYQDIHFGFSSLNIFDGAGGSSGEGGGEGEPYDVNADGYVSPLDALTIIRHLNGGSSTSSGDSDGFNPRLDVNKDTFVSPLDVLLVIRRLNGTGDGEGEAEGEFVSSFNTLEDSQDDLLANDPLSLPNVWDDPVGEVVELPEEPQPTASAPSVAVDDWQLRVGEQDQTVMPDPSTIAPEQWESLIDSLAEDVLEAWLEGGDI